MKLGGECNCNNGTCSIHFNRSGRTDKKMKTILKPELGKHTVNHDTLRKAVEEITGAQFRPTWDNRHDNFKSGDTNGVVWIDFRIDGRSFNLGHLLALSRRLATEDIEVDVNIDTAHVRDADDYSDPGPDHHINYSIKNARWTE